VEGWAWGGGIGLANLPPAPVRIKLFYTNFGNRLRLTGFSFYELSYRILLNPQTASGGSLSLIEWVCPCHDTGSACSPP